MNKLFLTALFILSGFLYGNVITVDLAGGGDYDSIHDAVAAASAGDSILVQSGQYDFTSQNGRITISKKLFIIGTGYDKVADGGTKIADINGTGLFLIDGSADGTVIKGSGFRPMDTELRRRTAQGELRLKIIF